METITDLLSAGVLSYALQPRDNPRDLNCACYSLPLIEHDYPARTAHLWNAAYRAFEMDCRSCMLVGNPDNVERILSAFRSDPKYRGGGMGVGFKEPAVHFIDECDPLVESLRAVNLVTRTGQRLRGYNTDGMGYAASLNEIFNHNLLNKRILLLGAGGTSSAVAFALAALHCRLTIANRTVARAQALCDRINLAFGKPVACAVEESRIPQNASDFNAIVNVSSIGSAGTLAAYSPLGPVTLPATEDHIQQNQQSAECVLNSLPRQTVLSDVVIAPGETPFLRMARAHGFRVLDGIPMVVNQAIESFCILHATELSASGIIKPEVTRIMKTATATP